MNRKLFLVAYDIRENRRLRQVHTVLKDYACGGQKSAFECYLTEREKQALIDRVREIMCELEDSLLVIHLSDPDAVATLGTAVMPADEQFTYLG